MATVLFKGVFDQILLKTAKNDRFDTLFPLCASPSPTFLGQLYFLTFQIFLVSQTWISKNLASFGSF